MYYHSRRSYPLGTSLRCRHNFSRNADRCRTDHHTKCFSKLREYWLHFYCKTSAVLDFCIRRRDSSTLYYLGRGQTHLGSRKYRRNMNSHEIPRLYYYRTRYYTFCLFYSIVYYQFFYLNSMKKICVLLWIFLYSLVPVFGSAGNCDYNGNPLENFKNCWPEKAIQWDGKPQTDVTDTGSDFMTLIQNIVERAQIIAFFIAVGIIVWLGLLMVLPANAEAKEATKWKLISVLLGFLAMISASIIINAVINLVYDIFGTK